jgi:ADP-ribose diphosphatase
MRGLAAMGGRIAELLILISDCRSEFGRSFSISHEKSAINNPPQSRIFLPMPTPAKRRKQARVLSSREVFSGPVFRVTTDRIHEPGGVMVRRDVVRHPGSVVILAVDESRPEPRVLLEWQYRHPARSFLWELPAGRIDEGEGELGAAKRELLEETGYTASHWRLALKYYSSPGFVDETMAVYLARGLRQGRAQPEEDEVIRKRFFTVSDIIQRIANGKIRDGKTIAGVLWLARHPYKRSPSR